MSSKFLMKFLMSKVIEVGAPPPSFRDHQSVLVHFHQFEGLEEGIYEESKPFKLFNHVWEILVSPGGDDDTVSVGLRLKSKGKISVRYLYIVRDASGEIVRKTRQWEGTFDEVGWSRNLVSRSTALEKVVINGTFTIELRMTPVMDSKSKYCKHFIPVNRAICLGNSDEPDSIISSLLFDEESADICFDVSSPSDDTKQSVKVYAHRAILKARAPDLFRLCTGYDVSNSMPISDVEPDIFRELMRYIYGLYMDNTNWGKDAKAILEAANKYDVANLKVTAEAWYVTYFEFTAENVTDQFLYADAMSCPLLKEAAVNFMVDNGVDVFSSDSFNTILEARGLTRELFLMMAKKLDSSSDSAAVDLMSIDDLKIRLNEYRFAVDGDREMLVRRFVDLMDSIDERNSQKEEQDRSIAADDQSIDADDDGSGDDGYQSEDYY